MNEMSCQKSFLDTGRVIAAVESQQNIWNPCHEDYKNKTKRAAAWSRVCLQVFDLFHQYTDEEQNELEKRVQQRWRTARDCYVKARTRPAAPAADSHYAFMEQLAFLEPTLALRRAPRPHPQPAVESSSKPRVKRSPSTARAKPGPRAEGEDGSMSPFERQLLAILRKTQSPLEEDDESFFRSLAPTLAALDPHHKLLFRSRVVDLALQLQAQSSASYMSAPPVPCDVGLQEDELPEAKYRPPSADSFSDDYSQPPPDST